MNKKKNGRIYLKQPTFDELWYRKKLLADPRTMEYNKGYESNIVNYNYDNGTIDFDETLWADFYQNWVKDKRDNYYAYIVRSVDDEYIGEIAYKCDDNVGKEVNIILESNARGFRYSLDALNLLAKEAFENRNVEKLQDNISESKYNAINIFSEAGYKKVGEAKPVKKFGQDENVIVVSYSKDEYMEKNHKKLFSFFSKF